MKKIDKIEIDRYTHDEGIFVRISVPSRELLVNLRNVIQELAEDKFSLCELSKKPFVKVSELTEFTLKLIPPSTISRKTVSLTDGKKDRARVFWLHSLEGWDECVGLIEGLLARLS